jgi:hypothetical protein
MAAPCNLYASAGAKSKQLPVNEIDAERLEAQSGTALEWRRAQAIRQQLCRNQAE